MAFDPLSTAVGGAVALGSAIYGKIASSKYNKQARQLIQNQRDDNRAWRDAEMAKNELDRTDAQAILTNQQRLLDERYNRSRKANVVSGGTDEALAMEKAAANNSLAQTEAAIAQNASERKDSVERQYRSEDAALNQQQAQSLFQQGKEAAQAASQGVNAGLNLLGIGLQKDNFVADAEQNNINKTK